MNEERLSFDVLPDGKYLVRFFDERASYNRFTLAILENYARTRKLRPAITKARGCL